jgi:hypothetical protein
MVASPDLLCLTNTQLQNLCQEDTVLQMVRPAMDRKNKHRNEPRERPLPAISWEPVRKERWC